MLAQDFFRHGYSTGEKYFYEKSKGIGGRAMNNTVVKPSLVAHITYTVLGVTVLIPPATIEQEIANTHAKLKITLRLGDQLRQQPPRFALCVRL